MVSPKVRQRRRALARAAGEVVLVGLGVLLAWVLISGDDVRNPNVRFEEADAPTRERPPARTKVDNFRWPYYGFTAQRTRDLDAERWLRPPFTQRWKLGGSSLLEFAPVMAKGRLFLLKNNGSLLAVDKLTGEIEWQRPAGSLAASSPAVSGNRVFTTVLQRKGADNGAVLAFSATTGKTLWQRNVPSRTESSPVVSQGNVYLGSEDGTVYSLRAKDGRVQWTYSAGGAVKAGLALSKGVLYFGAYGGSVHAVRAKDGGEVWTSSAGGNVYSTAAVAFGRVYLGSIDSSVYSFSTDDGELAWSKSTGDYVYASPAVADIDGLGPTVFIGSYDGTFYALDAQSGDERWSHSAGGKISGSATIVGRVVYFANLDARSTTALSAATGDELANIGKGSFNPVISDGRRIYLTGYTSVYGLDAKSAPKSIRGEGWRELQRARRNPKK